MVAIADLRILNVDGGVPHGVDRARALNNFVNREMAAFEAATGLSEWEEPNED